MRVIPDMKVGQEADELGIFLCFDLYAEDEVIRVQEFHEVFSLPQYGYLDRKSIERLDTGRRDSGSVAVAFVEIENFHAHVHP